MTKIHPCDEVAGSSLQNRVIGQETHANQKRNCTDKTLSIKPGAWHQLKAEVKIAGKRKTNQIWKTKGNGSKMNFSFAAFANAPPAIMIEINFNQNSENLLLHSVNYKMFEIWLEEVLFSKLQTNSN